MAKKKKFRAEFRKNRTPRARKTDWTRQFDEHGFQEQAPETEERISGRGEVNRHRTICTAEATAELGDAELPFDVLLDVDMAACRRGRVLSVFGQASTVQGDDGIAYQCATRRILKTLITDERNPVVAGDVVLFRPGENPQSKEGLIERVEPRRGTLSRAVRGRRQVIVSNVDQLLIVASVAEPRLKPNLIDRLLVAARKRPRAADYLHQQDRPHRAGELGAPGRCLLSHGLPGAAGQRQDRLRNGSSPPPCRRTGERRGRPERRGQVVACSTPSTRICTSAWARSVKRTKKEAYDHHRQTAAHRLRRFCRRHAGDAEF